MSECYFQIPLMKPGNPAALMPGLKARGFFSSEQAIFQPCLLPAVPRGSLSPERGPADSVSPS